MGRAGRNARAKNRNSAVTSVNNHRTSQTTQQSQLHARNHSEAHRSTGASTPLDCPVVGVFGGGNVGAQGDIIAPRTGVKSPQPYDKNDSLGQAPHANVNGVEPHMTTPVNSVTVNVQENVEVPSLFHGVALSSSGVGRLYDNLRDFGYERFSIPEHAGKAGTLYPHYVVEPDARFVRDLEMRFDGIFFFLRHAHSGNSIIALYRVLAIVVWIAAPFLAHDRFIARGASPVLLYIFLILLRGVTIGERDTQWDLTAGFRCVPPGTFSWIKETDNVGKLGRAASSFPPGSQTFTCNGFSYPVPAAGNCLVPIEGVYLGYFREDATFLFAPFGTVDIRESVEYTPKFAPANAEPRLRKLPPNRILNVNLPNGLTPSNPLGMEYLRQIVTHKFSNLDVSMAPRNSLPGPFVFYSRYSKWAFQTETLLYASFAFFFLPLEMVYFVITAASLWTFSMWVGYSVKALGLYASAATLYALFWHKEFLFTSEALLRFSGQYALPVRIFTCYAMGLLLAGLFVIYPTKARKRAYFLSWLCGVAAKPVGCLRRAAWCPSFVRTAVESLFRCLSAIVNDVVTYDACIIVAFWVAVVMIERVYRVPLTSIYALLSAFMMIRDKGNGFSRARTKEEAFLVGAIFLGVQLFLWSTGTSTVALCFFTSVMRVGLVIRYIAAHHCGLYAPNGVEDETVDKVFKGSGDLVADYPFTQHPLKTKNSHLREAMNADHECAFLYAAFGVALLVAEYWYYPRESYPYVHSSSPFRVQPDVFWQMPTTGALEMRNAVGSVFALAETLACSRFVATLPVTFFLPFYVTAFLANQPWMTNNERSALAFGELRYTFIQPLINLIDWFAGDEKVCEGTAAGRNAKFEVTQTDSHQPFLLWRIFCHATSPLGSVRRTILSSLRRGDDQAGSPQAPGVVKLRAPHQEAPESSVKRPVLQQKKNGKKSHNSSTSPAVTPVMEQCVRDKKDVDRSDQQSGKAAPLVASATTSLEMANTGDDSDRKSGDDVPMEKQRTSLYEQEEQTTPVQNDDAEEAPIEPFEEAEDDSKQAVLQQTRGCTEGGDGQSVTESELAVTNGQHELAVVDEGDKDAGENVEEAGDITESKVSESSDPHTETEETGQQHEAHKGAEKCSVCALSSENTLKLPAVATAVATTKKSKKQKALEKLREKELLVAKEGAGKKPNTQFAAPAALAAAGAAARDAKDSSLVSPCSSLTQTSSGGFTDALRPRSAAQSSTETSDGKASAAASITVPKPRSSLQQLETRAASPPPPRQPSSAPTDPEKKTHNKPVKESARDSSTSSTGAKKAEASHTPCKEAQLSSGSNETKGNVPAVSRLFATFGGTMSAVQSDGSVCSGSATEDDRKMLSFNKLATDSGAVPISDAAASSFEQEPPQPSQNFSTLSWKHASEQDSIAVTVARQTSTQKEASQDKRLPLAEAPAPAPPSRVSCVPPLTWQAPEALAVPVTTSVAACEESGFPTVSPRERLVHAQTSMGTATAVAAANSGSISDALSALDDNGFLDLTNLLRRLATEAADEEEEGRGCPTAVPDNSLGGAADHLSQGNRWSVHGSEAISPLPSYTPPEGHDEELVFHWKAARRHGKRRSPVNSNGTPADDDEDVRFSEAAGPAATFIAKPPAGFTSASPVRSPATAPSTPPNGQRQCESPAHPPMDYSSYASSFGQQQQLHAPVQTAGQHPFQPSTVLYSLSPNPPLPFSMPTQAALLHQQQQLTAEQLSEALAQQLQQQQQATFNGASWLSTPQQMVLSAPPPPQQHQPFLMMSPPVAASLPVQPSSCGLTPSAAAFAGGSAQALPCVGIVDMGGLAAGEGQRVPMALLQLPDGRLGAVPVDTLSFQQQQLLLQHGQQFMSL